MEPFINIGAFNTSLKAMKQVWPFPGPIPESVFSLLSSARIHRTAALEEERISGVLPSDLPRATEQNGLWLVTQKGSLAVSHGIMCKFTINVLTKENISTIDYLLITILLHILYL